MTVSIKADLTTLTGDSDGVLTLAGELSGANEVDESVTEIVLNGVQGTEDSSINLNSSVVIKITDGTENYINSISSIVESIEFQGGGNLKLSQGIATWDGNIVCNHTGNINVYGGNVVSISGTIVLNSGQLYILNEEDDYALSSAQGQIELNGGSLETAGDGGAVIAAEINVADSVAFDGNIEVMTDDEGKSASVITNGSGTPVTQVEASGEDAKNVEHIKVGVTETAAAAADSGSDKDTDNNQTSSGSSDSENSQGNASIGIGTIILIIVAVVVVAAAVLAFVMTFKRSKKAKHKSKKRGRK